MSNTDTADNATAVDKEVGAAICVLLDIKPTDKMSFIGIAQTCKRICHTAEHETDGTDDEDTAIGRKLIDALNLHVKKSNGRVDTDGGDKTPCGLSRTVKRVIHEADYS